MSQIIIEIIIRMFSSYLDFTYGGEPMDKYVGLEMAIKPDSPEKFFKLVKMLTKHYIYDDKLNVYAQKLFKTCLTINGVSRYDYIEDTLKLKKYNSENLKDLIYAHMALNNKDGLYNPTSLPNIYRILK